MNDAIGRLAYAVLLPAVEGLDPVLLRPLLDAGCRAVLLGETRAEYLARAMNAERVARETRETVLRAVEALRGQGDEELLVAVDHEVVGIRRLRHLLPPDDGAEPDAVRETAAAAGRRLRELGVNVALGPVVDVVRGEQSWLAGRNLGPDPARVAAIGAAAVEGLQASGVASVAKHYPGYPILADDPAVAPAVMREPLDERDERPFAAVVAAGVRGLMLGPAVVEAIDSRAAASCSAAVVRRARQQLGFTGTLVSDDLDAVGILRGGHVGDAAVASLAAGADLLLVAAQAAPACAAALSAAVTDGRVPVERLADAAERVGQLAPVAA